MPAGAARPVEPAKKNAEPSASLAASLQRELANGGHSLGNIPPLAKTQAETERAEKTGSIDMNPVAPMTAPAVPQLEQRPEPAVVDPPALENGGATSESSVLKQFQQAMANPPTDTEATARSARPSRRQQLAEIAEQPFVKRAMELFDVAPGQFRYTPPEGDAN